LLDFLPVIGVGIVDHVQEQVGESDFLEGGLEGGDQLVREFFDEADRVGENDLLGVAGGHLAGGRIEGGEEGIGGGDVGAGEAVEEGRFAGVGVADKGDFEEVFASFALGGALFPEAVDFLFEVGDFLADLAPVDFELGFAGALGADPDTAVLAAEVGPGAGQAGEHVFELGQFDLQFGGRSAGVEGENIEDEDGAVDDLDIEGFLEIALLGRGERVVEDDQVDAVAGEFLLELFDEPFADEIFRVGDTGLDDLVGDRSAGGDGQLGEFVERRFDIRFAVVFPGQADQAGFFEYDIFRFDH